MRTDVSERRDDVQDYFLRHASRFDGLYGDGSRATRVFDRVFRKPMYQRYQSTIKELGRHAADKRYLDVGCGSGRYAVNLAKLGAEVVGVDFSRTMLDLAQKYADEEQVTGRTTFIEADMDEWMESTDERFDAAYAMGVFDYLADPVRTLRSMLRIAGHALLSLPAPEFPRAQLRRLRYARQHCPVFFYTRTDAEQLVDEAGGKVVSISPLGKRSGFFIHAARA
jgi:ubiquinone/menaquinone biosynthesis C-methylase UbiE